MGLADRIRRVFATVGSNPNTPKDEPRGFGAGVIRRLKLTNNYGNRNYEQHIGDNRTYMNVYLSDPIVRSLIDLPCLYAVKDGFDIVTASVYGAPIFFLYAFSSAIHFVE